MTMMMMMVMMTKVVYFEWREMKNELVLHCSAACLRTRALCVWLGPISATVLPCLSPVLSMPTSTLGSLLHCMPPITTACLGFDRGHLSAAVGAAVPTACALLWHPQGSGEAALSTLARILGSIIEELEAGRLPAGMDAGGGAAGSRGGEARGKGDH